MTRETENAYGVAYVCSKVLVNLLTIKKNFWFSGSKNNNVLGVPSTYVNKTVIPFYKRKGKDKYTKCTNEKKIIHT